MSMGMTLRQSVRQEIRQTLTLAQKIAMELKRYVITPKAECSECGCQLSEDDIRSGWLEDPNDTTTACPDCGSRFQAILIVTHPTKDDKREFSYLCPDQLFLALAKVRRGKNGILGQAFLHEKHPNLLFNIVRHFGEYRYGLCAFKASGY